MAPHSYEKEVVLTTLATGNYNGLLKYSGPVLKAYANKWGWDYVPVMQSLDYDRPDAWSKILAITQLLEKYESVVYIDSDALILNLHDNILQAVPKQFEFAWCLGEINGVQTPNAGVMVVRKSKRTVLMFKQAYEFKHLIYDSWWDQIALMTVLNYPDPRKRKVIKRTESEGMAKPSVYELPIFWNVTSQEVGISKPYIRHFAGDPFILKMLMMIEYLSRSFSESELDELGFNKATLLLEYNNIRSELYSELTRRSDKIRFTIQSYLAKLNIREIKYK